MMRTANDNGIVSPPQNPKAGERQGWLEQLHLIRPAVPRGPVALDPSHTWSLVVAAGAAIRLLEGQAWVTFENDVEDHFLDAGAVVRAPSQGRVAVQALAPTRFAVEAGTRLAA